MAPPKSSSGGGGGGGDDSKREHPLQAVLLGDSFTRSFRPLSLDKPKVLCPLNNVAMIDYSIEFLAGAGVQELIILCLREEVEIHVQKNAWVKRGFMHVTFIKDSSLTNAGDALRELDKRNIVQSDPFILMYGDTVTNVDIKPALVAHKARHKKDSSAMMTLLMKDVGGWKATPQTLFSSIRSSQDDLIVGLDPTKDNRILLYDDRNQRKVCALPCSFFASHSQIDLRCDLLDCGIDICSPDVLARFSDEFDYRDIRREFVSNSVAEEEEGLQNKIFCYLLSDHEYAARVHDFQTYAAISRDLLKRWCYPVVPDNLPSGYEQEFRYQSQRDYIYREVKRGQTNFCRSTTIKGASMIGAQCVIGENSIIESTVIGNGCKIGARVSLKGCHLWGPLIIEDNVTIEHSILGNDVMIKSGARIGRGSVIGSGCVIGKNVCLPEYSWITLKVDTGFEDDDAFEDSDEESDESDSSQEKNEFDDNLCLSDTKLVGTDGQGFLWRPIAEESESDLPTLIEVLKSQCIGFDRTELYKQRYEFQKEDYKDFDAEAVEQNIEDFHDNEVDFSMDYTQNQQGIFITGRQKGVDVVKELKLICLELEDSSPIENLAIELNSFKFSQNATYSDCTMAAMLAILEKMDINSSMKGGKLVTALKTQLVRWSPLLKKMSIGLEEEKGIILALEMATIADDEIGKAIRTEPHFRFLLQTLHDQDLLSEEAILSWAETRRKDDQTSDKGKLFYQQPTQDFLEWLEGDDDSNDEEDEGESSDEE